MVRGRSWWGIGVGLLASVGVLHAQGAVQTPSRLVFEVASVRENRSEDKPSSNFPLNPGPQFNANGGLLIARNMLLLQYIVFAYKPTSYQIQVLRGGLPEWTRSAHYDIEARAEGTPDKDEMRAMMRALLEERFRMRVHRETREVPVFALVQVVPGRLGPKLRVHPADDPDCKKTPLPAGIAGGYPPQCGAGASVAPSAPGLTAIAGRKVTLEVFTYGLTNMDNNVDRPVLDRTGLSGVYDFALEWTPAAAEAVPDGDAAGPGFFGALKEQLGLKLVLSKGPVEVMVLDGVERPVAN